MRDFLGNPAPYSNSGVLMIQIFIFQIQNFKLKFYASVIGALDRPTPHAWVKWGVKSLSFSIILNTVVHKLYGKKS